MTDKDVKKLRGVIREEVTVIIEEKVGVIVEEKLKPVNKKLTILWDQAEKVAFALDEVNETLDSHSKVLKRIEVNTENNSDDIHKLNKRVVTLENTAGIVPPPELAI